MPHHPHGIQVIKRNGELPFVAFKILAVHRLLVSRGFIRPRSGNDDQGQTCLINRISSKKSIENQIVIVSLICMIRIVVSGQVRLTPLINGRMST
jgi:hypothetical protein